MKALTWRRWISIAVGMLALALASQPLMATQPAAPIARSPAPDMMPGLPSGLPALPGLGETMQRDFRSGLALHGYDPVAYQIAGSARPGRAEYEIVHRGAVWRFASEANRAAFSDAPEVYEPAFAGFDAKSVAEGRAVETDPRQFAIIGSRLFMFRTAENRAGFIKDTSLMTLAESRWSDVLNTIAN